MRPIMLLRLTYLFFCCSVDPYKYNELQTLEGEGGCRKEGEDGGREEGAGVGFGDRRPCREQFSGYGRF